LGLIVLVVVSNIVQSKVVNKKVKNENIATQDKIRNHLGQENFDELVKAQEEHYQKYFSFDEQPMDSEVEEIGEVEVLEEENVTKDGELNDGK
jgi:hypothetical protein